MEDLRADSPDMMEIVMKVEDEFDRSRSRRGDVENIKTVGRRSE